MYPEFITIFGAFWTLNFDDYNACELLLQCSYWTQGCCTYEGSSEQSTAQLRDSIESQPEEQKNCFFIGYQQHTTHPSLIIHHPTPTPTRNHHQYGDLSQGNTYKEKKRIPLCGSTSVALSIVIVTGNPGVFQGYPDPYPSKPIPATRGRGLGGYG